jgi:large subunit ribosomal protein L14
MIQKGTFLNIIDNSGAKFGICIHVYSGYKSRYAGIGSTILVSIKTLRSKRRVSSKIKKGEMYKALIVRTKKPLNTFSGGSISFLDNSIILLNKQNKFIGTKVFGSIPKSFRYSKFLRIASLSAGLVS